jgi:aminoglycoside N3'-acetyltransferase
MSVPEVSESTIIDALIAVGLQPGDDLLVHSALQFLGRPIGGIGMYLDALRAVIDDTSTIAVPTFNFAFARGEDYDPLTTPSDGMGVFSEYVRQLPDARRTAHPMQSFAFAGPLASELAALDRPGAFDDGSTFDHILALDFKLLLLGATIQAASVVHYSEQRANVPYRYWKDFTGRIKRDGDWGKHTYRMFVRDLEKDPQLTLAPVQDALQINGKWREQSVNYGSIAVCGLADFVSTTDQLLAADPWALVANRRAVEK